MAIGMDAESGDMGGQPTPPPGPGGPAASGPPGANASPPPGGGPMLAALTQQQQGQPQSAPGPGANADSLNKVFGAVKMLEAALAGLGAGSPPYKDTLKAIQSLTKHLPQGSPTAGVQKTMFSDMLQGTVKNALLQKLASNGQGQPGQQAPNPSMPQPGS